MSQPTETNQRPPADLIAEGRDALFAGERTRARELLQAAVREDPDNAEAWLWLSGTHTAPSDMAFCLREALRLDPGNEQARDGLAWLEAKHGLPQPPLETETSDIQPPPIDEASPPTDPIPPHGRPDPRELVARQRVVTTRPKVQLNTSTLSEAASHAIAVGVLLGLLRLALLLRPETLVLVRSGRGPIEPLPAVILAVAAAVLHGGALFFAWLVLGYSIAQAHQDRPKNRRDSLLRSGRIFVPGYGLLIALLLVAVGLGWNAQRWMPVATVVWIIMLGSGILMLRRLWQLLKELGGAHRPGIGRLVRVVVPALAIAAAGMIFGSLGLRALLAIL